MNKLAIDLGTTTIKCGLVKEGKIVNLFAREYPLEKRGGFVEQNPDDWWNIVCEGIRAVAEDEDIDAICISSQGITVLPVDKEGRPLTKALSWLDTRAIAETREVEERFGGKFIFDTTGKRMLPYYTLPKIMWLKRNGIDASKYVMPLDYLNFKLTGRFVADYTMASGTMLYDIYNKCYSKPLLDFCGISEDMLPEVLPMGSEVGNLLPEAAERLGLSPDVKVILGGQDQKMSVVACGIKEQAGCVSIGTSTAINIFTKAEKDYSVFRFDDEKLIYESAITTTGAVIKWLKQILGLSSYAEMDALAGQAGGSNGIEFDINFADSGYIKGLSLHSEKGQIIYALYEAIAREIKLRTVPYGIKHLIIYGGGAKSAILLDIIKKVTGCTTETPEITETALLGAAKLIRG